MVNNDSLFADLSSPLPPREIPGMEESDHSSALDLFLDDDSIVPEPDPAAASSKPKGILGKLVDVVNHKDTSKTLFPPAASRSRPSRKAKLEAATKIRERLEEPYPSDHNLEEDHPSDQNSETSSHNSDGEEGPKTHQDRPKRLAKTVAIQKLDLCNSDSSKDGETTQKVLRGTEPDERDPPEEDPEDVLSVVSKDTPPLKSEESDDDDECGDEEPKSHKDEEKQASDDQDASEEAVEENGVESGGTNKRQQSSASVNSEDSVENEEGRTNKRKRSSSSNGTTEDCIKEEGSDEPSKKKSKRPRVSEAVVEDAAEKNLEVSIKSSSSKVKTEACIKEEEGDEPSKKKPKRQRVSEAVVKDAAEKMLEVLIKSSSSKVKTEACIKEEGGDGPSKKKPKRQRVSEAVVKDAAEKMLEVLIKNYKDDVREIPMDILASSIKSKKGKPYKNHRSDAIMEGMKLLKAEQKAERVPSGTSPFARLLPAEIEKIPKEVISKDPAKVLEQRLEQFLNRLADEPKGGRGEKIVKAANAVWNKLLDGKGYKRKHLVRVTDYKGTNSSGFEAIVKVLVAMKFVENDGGKLSFTKKVFPHGRP